MTSFLDLQQLKAFYFVCKARSYTRAAQAMGRTQSAVSHALKKLEEGLGVQLIQHSGRHFQLTEEGQILFAAARSTFTVLDEAMEGIAHRQGAALGSVRLGATVEFGCSILVKHLEAFVEANPKIRIDLHLSNELITPLREDQLDIVIDCVDHQESGIERIPLFRERYAVVCSSTYQRRLSILRPQDLERCTLLSLDSQGAWWNHFLYSLPGIERPVLERHHYRTINLIRGMIRGACHHMGVALVPLYSVAQELAQGSLIQLFPTVHLLEDQFSLYQKRDRKGLLRHQRVVEYLRKMRPNELPSLARGRRP